MTYTRENFVKLMKELSEIWCEIVSIASDDYLVEFIFNWNSYRFVKISETNLMVEVDLYKLNWENREKSEMWLDYSSL